MWSLKLPVKGVVDQRIAFRFGGRKSDSDPVDETREIVVKPGPHRKFPTGYVILGTVSFIGGILGIGWVRKKRR